MNKCSRYKLVDVCFWETWETISGTVTTKRKGCKEGLQETVLLLHWTMQQNTQIQALHSYLKTTYGLYPLLHCSNPAASWQAQAEHPQTGWAFNSSNTVSLAVVKLWPSWTAQKPLLCSSSAVLVLSQCARAAISLGGKRRSSLWALKLLTPAGMWTGAVATEVGIKTSLLEVPVVPLPLEMGTCLPWTHLLSCQVGDNMRG